MKKRIIVWAIIILAVIIFGGACVLTATILPLDENGNVIREDQTNDDEIYVDAHWDAMTAEISENAVDIKELIEKTKDLSEGCEDYFAGGGKEIQICGDFNVVSVNTESKAGTITVVPEGYSGECTFEVQIGTIFKGTALRDSFSCVSFSDCDNQMEWSQVSKDLMNRIAEEQIAAIDMDGLVGTKINVLGAFTYSSSSKNIVIQPFSIAEE